MIHRHLIVRGRGRGSPSASGTVLLLREIIDSVGMRIADVPGNPLVYECATKGNEGITAAAVIETSHCVLHTWPHETHTLTLFQFDLYSCANFDPLAVLTLLKKRLALVTFERMVIDRDIGLRVTVVA